MNERGRAERQKNQACRNMLEAIRQRALCFLQLAPAMEGRRDIEALDRHRGISACEPEICSIALLTTDNLITVRCHTCKRGGLWRDLRK